MSHRKPPREGGADPSPPKLRGKAADGVAAAENTTGLGGLSGLELKPLSFPQKVLLDAYTEAIKNALTANSDANGALLTASLSIATLYGALVALVAPKNSASPFIILLPILPLVGSFLAAAIGKTSGISLKEAPSTNQVALRLTSAINTQRRWMFCSIGTLILGLVVGGVVLANVYGRTTRPGDHVVAYLAPEGRSLVATLCKQNSGTIVGTTNLSSQSAPEIVFKPDRGQPCAGMDLTLPSTAIAALLATPGPK